MTKTKTKIRHGTNRGYRQGCRLPCCRQAHTRDNQETVQRARERFQKTGDLPSGRDHGLYVYRYYGCRCDVCSAANNAKPRS